MKKLILTLLSILFSLTWSLAQDNIVSHTVEKGETLTSIARRYGVTEAEIVRYNPGAAQFVYVGMELVIPQPATSVSLPDESLASSINPPGTGDVEATLFSSDEQEQYRKVIWGLVMHGPFNEYYKVFKYGASIGLESMTFFPNKKLGFELSMLLNCMWWDSFTVAGSSMTLGTVYAVPLIENNLDLYIPVGLACSLYSDADDKVKAAWACRINPQFHIARRINVGVFADIRKEVGFGLTLGICFDSLIPQNNSVIGKRKKTSGNS